MLILGTAAFFNKRRGRDEGIDLGVNVRRWHDEGVNLGMDVKMVLLSRPGGPQNMRLRHNLTFECDVENMFPSMTKKNCLIRI